MSESSRSSKSGASKDEVDMKAETVRSTVWLNALLAASSVGASVAITTALMLSEESSKFNLIIAITTLGSLLILTGPFVYMSRNMQTKIFNRALCGVVLVLQLGSYSTLKIDDGAEWQADMAKISIGIRAFYLLAFGLVNLSNQ